MARFNIIDALTGAVKYSGAPKYNGVYCKPSYLEFTEIASPVPVDWKVGDYVVYSRTGMTYRLYDIPQPKKQSRRTEYGGAFVYQNVQFFADTKWLDIEPFRDIVLDDNEIHFSTRESWSVWTNVASLLERMQAVMDASGSARFTFRLVDATQGSDLYELLHDNYQDFTISGESVMGGLEKIYEQWGNIGWLHTVENGVNVITVGIPPVRVDGIGTDTDDEFIYGMGHALTSLRRTATNRDALRTRLYVYGSTRNMIPRYYNNLTPYIKDHESVDIQHLMIPLSEWGLTSGERDAAKAYLENNVSGFGVRPDSVYFDGSELEEIYPSIEKATIGNLYDSMESGAEYRPDLSVWDRDDRLDEVVSASGITDDGQQSSSGSKYTQVQYVSTLAHATSEYENFSQYLIENHHLGYSGKITIDFRGLTATVTDNSGSVQAFECRLVAHAGSRRESVDVAWTKSGNVYSLAIPAISLVCDEGDSLYVSLFVNFRADRTNSPVTFSVLSRSVAIQYASNYADTFVIRIPQIGFDIASRSNLGSEGIATIAMRDGMCGGRSFAVKSCSYVSSADAWDLTVYRGRDEGLDILFPNTGFPISAGDHFVLLDIAMPDTYIGIAEQRLLAAGRALLEDVSRIKPFYEPEINSKYVYENGLELREGWYMPVRDADITAGQSEYVLIDTLTINEGESNIPTYRVTLREQKRTSYTNTGTMGGGTSMTSLAGGSVSDTKSGGTVSVGLTMPEQFSVGGSPVAGTGTIAVSLNPLYAIPTAEQVATLAILASMLEVKNYASGKWALHVKPTALDASGTMRTIDGIYSEGFVSAGGIGPGGQGGGSIVSWSQTVTTGTKIATITIDGVATDVYAPSQVTWANISGKPSWIGSTKPSYAFSEITGTAAATQIPSLDAGKITSGTFAAARIPTLAIGKISGLQTALDAKETTTHAAATYQPLATAINTGNIASQSVARAHGLTSVQITASFDLNTALSGGGVTGNYGGTSYWVNGPSGMGFGSVAQIQASTDRGDQLALQLAWDIEHNSTSSTKRLWFRSSNNLGWQADWKEIYHSGNLTSLSQLGQDAAHRLVTDAQIALWTKIANLFDTDRNGNVYVRNEKGFYSYSFITAGGIGSGGGGSTGALYTCVDVTAYNNSEVGRDSTHPALPGDLLAYDGNKWHAVVAPATGVTSISVNGGSAQTGEVSLTIPTALSSLSADANHRLVTDAEKAVWNAKQSAISDLATIRSNAANGQTAYGWGNHASAGYAAASSLSNYLPLSGGAITNTIHMDGSSTNIPFVRNYTNTASSGWSRLLVSMQVDGVDKFHIGAYGIYAAAASDNGISYAHLGFNAYNGDNLRIYSDHLTFGSNLIYHAGNLTKATLGLGNVDNTADSVKSVAYSTNAGQLGGIAAANYYHSGNSNKSDVAWACSTLTASGNITGALLKSTTNGNTVTIGSQNASFCHIYNSADVPFIFNKDIQTTGGLLPYGGGTHDLGNSSHRWGDAYVSGINASGNATIAGSLSMGNTLNMSGNEVLFDSSSVLYINRGLQSRTVDFFGTNIRFHNSGNVGIGTTSPSQKLHVVGNIIATGAITAGAASDARLKDNIRNLANAVTVLKSLRPVSFDWNATATSNYSALKGHDVGLVAQEVEPYIPSAVGTIFGNYKRLDYTKVTPYLIAGWQDHESRLSALEKEHAELKRRLNIN